MVPVVSSIPFWNQFVSNMWYFCLHCIQILKKITFVLPFKGWNETITLDFTSDFTLWLWLKWKFNLSTNELDDFQDWSFGSGIQSLLHIKIFETKKTWHFMAVEEYVGIYIICTANCRQSILNLSIDIQRLDKKSSRSRDNLLYFGCRYPKVG